MKGLAIVVAATLAATTSLPGLAQAADICGAIRLLRFNHENDFAKYRGAARSNGKYVGKLKIDGTEFCVLSPKGSTDARYSCYSADMTREAARAELKEVIADVDECLKNYRWFKKETARDSRSTILDTTWVGNGEYINVSGDLSAGSWAWSISVFRGTRD